MTTGQLIEHLYSTYRYGNVTPADLIENDERMKSSYDPSQPIEVLFDQIEDAVDLANAANAANAAYTIPQIVEIAYNSVFLTGLFADACREWRRRPLAYKLWITFKTNFALARQELRELQVTSQSAGFHLANKAYEVIQQDMVNPLANLVTATTSDCSTASQLSTTNSQLSVQLQETSCQLGQAMNDSTILKQEIKTLHQSTSNGTLAGQHQQQQQRRPFICKWFNDNKYWSHGYHVANDHTSATCTKQRDGHKTAATCANHMGGKLWQKIKCT